MMLVPLDWQSAFTSLVIIGLIGALVYDRIRPHYLFMTALLLLLLTGVVSPVQAVSGFTSPAVLTVAALFIVSAGVQHTRMLEFLDRFMVPDNRGTGPMLLRMMSCTSLMSSFLNNTPIVVMLIPRIEQWAGRCGIPVSKLLIPLSYAAIVGGTITLIGTSTNIIVSGMLSDRGYAPFHLFELAWIGVPATLLVIVWFVCAGHHFLPSLQPSADTARPVEIVNNVPESKKQLSVHHRFRIQMLLQPFILILMMGSIVIGLLPVHISVILAALATVATGCVPAGSLLKAFHFPVLLVIATALGIGASLEQTGLAELIALSMLDMTSGMGVLVVLTGIYIMTNLLTEMITNNAAAVLMIPIAISYSYVLDIDPHAVGVTVAVAASSSFLSPIGYQTNLLVMEPGGYRVADYMKAGLPVTLILMAVTLGVVGWRWL